MNKDQVTGKIDQAVGKVKQSVGEAAIGALATLSPRQVREIQTSYREGRKGVQCKHR